MSRRDATVAGGMLVLMLVGALVAPSPSAQVAANPPLLVRLDREAIAVAPDGTEIVLPAGSTIDACGDVPIGYELAARSVRVAHPCRGLLSDGFEAQ